MLGICGICARQAVVKGCFVGDLGIVELGGRIRNGESREKRWNSQRACYLLEAKENDNNQCSSA